MAGPQPALAHNTVVFFINPTQASCDFALYNDYLLTLNECLHQLTIHPIINEAL